MAAARPVILCGKSAEMALAVKGLLAPEFEVIHIITSVKDAVMEIPPLLEGKTPPPGETENLGTRNYSKKPIAVVTGAGFDDEAVAEMRTACGEKGIWLRRDMSKPAPPFGPKYTDAVVERTKSCLEKLIEEKKLEENGVFLY